MIIPAPCSNHRCESLLVHFVRIEPINSESLWRAVVIPPFKSMVMLLLASREFIRPWLSLGESCSRCDSLQSDIESGFVCFRCVISALCDVGQEFQRINPTTQVALSASCIGMCDTQPIIQWNVYYGVFNVNSNVTQWLPFSQMMTYDQIWFFGNRALLFRWPVFILFYENLGRNTNQFTSTNRLFVENPAVQYWRFEVIYRFASAITSSALNFVMNRPPSSGSCSISPSNGTTSTLFTITCSAWSDENGIKDYSIYGMPCLSMSRITPWPGRMEYGFGWPNADQLLAGIEYPDTITGRRSPDVIAPSTGVYPRSARVCDRSEHFFCSCSSGHRCHQ